MGILEGKKVLITGVLTEASIAFSAARLAQEQGAEVLLSSFGRMLPITTKIAERLPKPAEVIEQMRWRGQCHLGSQASL